MQDSSIRRVWRWTALGICTLRTREPSHPSIDVSSGVIETVAGTGKRVLGGRRDRDQRSSLNEPTGLAYDTVMGRLLIVDTANHRVVALEEGTLRTLVGDGRPGLLVTVGWRWRLGSSSRRRSQWTVRVM